MKKIVFLIGVSFSLTAFAMEQEKTLVQIWQEELKKECEGYAEIQKEANEMTKALEQSHNNPEQSFEEQCETLMLLKLYPDFKNAYVFTNVLNLSSDEISDLKEYLKRKIVFTKARLKYTLDFKKTKQLLNDKELRRYIKLEELHLIKNNLRVYPMKLVP